MDEIPAIFEDGVFKPEQPVTLPPRTRVRLSVQAAGTVTDARLAQDWSRQRADDKAWLELEESWDECVVHSGGTRPSRDQLHERR